MRISTKDLREVLKVGISLTVEKNENRLLSAIVEKGIDITHCDACTLYMYEDNKLVFRIMKTISKNINRGMDGATITDIPPVPYKEENVCAYTAINRKIINIEDVYDSLSVNKFMSDYYFTGATVQPGKSAIIEIELDNDSLEKNKIMGVEDVTEVEVKLKIEDDNGDALDTPNVIIKY